VTAAKTIALLGETTLRAANNSGLKAAVILASAGTAKIQILSVLTGVNAAVPRAFPAL